MLLGGCLPHTPTTTPQAPFRPPSRYQSEADLSSESGPRRASRPRRDAREPWWVSFRDPRLSAVERKALTRNLQLQGAWARLDQARALAAQSGAARWPQVNAEASISRQRVRFGSFPAQEFNAYTASVPVSYELDLFDRLGAAAAAAELDAYAARDDVEAVAMTLTAEIAEAWYNLVQADLERRLLAEQLETNETFLELIRARFEQGLSTALDRYQQEQQIHAVHAQLALVDARRSVLRNQLAVLVGTPNLKRSDAPNTGLPDLPPLPPVGVPAELVEQRPDVRASRRRVVSADYRVGAAIADRYPALRLTGNVGFNSNSLAELLDSFVWSIAGAIAQPLIDGGRRSAEVDRTRAVVRERLTQYGETLLTAITEVNNSIAQEHQQRKHIEALTRREKAARQNLHEARNRYREGLSEFLPVLTALISLQQTQLNLLSAQRQLVSFRIQLHRALGGSWVRSLRPPPTQEAHTRARHRITVGNIG